MRPASLTRQRRRVRVNNFAFVKRATQIFSVTFLATECGAAIKLGVRKD
jgi:hypothetical protein